MKKPFLVLNTFKWKLKRYRWNSQKTWYAKRMKLSTYPKFVKYIIFDWKSLIINISNWWWRFVWFGTNMPPQLVHDYRLQLLFPSGDCSIVNPSCGFISISFVLRVWSGLLPRLHPSFHKLQNRFSISSCQGLQFSKA